jgi:hypothetical protein
MQTQAASSSSALAVGDATATVDGTFGVQQTTETPASE